MSASRPFADADDLTVVAAYQHDRSDPAARELIDRHTPRLLRTVARVLGDHAGSAEDVLQEAWIRAFAALGHYRADASFLTWMTRVAVRSALDALRRRDHRIALLSIDEARSLVADQGDRDLATDLERALARLPSGMRSVGILHDIEGWTHAEIATELGIAIGTSKATLFTARRRLRTLLRADTARPDEDMA